VGQQVEARKFRFNMGHKGRNGESTNDAKSGSVTPRLHSNSRSPRAGSGGGNAGSSSSANAPSVLDIQEEVRKAMAGDEARFAASVAQSITKSVTDAVAEPTKNLVVSTVTTIMQPFQTKLNEVETAVSTLQTGQSEIKDELRSIKETLEKLGKGTNGSQNSSRMVGSPSLPNLPPPTHTPQSPVAPEPTVFTQTGFYRQPDPTILLCNTQNGTKVSREKFWESVVALLGEAGLQESTVDCTGDDLDNRFELQFKGDRRTATARCLQFHSSLQLGRGKWKSTVVEAADGVQVPFYTDVDRNGATIRKEIMSKKLFDIVKEMLPGKTVFRNKKNGTLYIDRKPLATLHITGEFTTFVQWYPPACIAVGLDKDVATTKYTVLEGGPSP